MLAIKRACKRAACEKATVKTRELSMPPLSPMPVRLTEEADVVEKCLSSFCDRYKLRENIRSLVRHNSIGALLHRAPGAREALPAATGGRVQGLSKAGQRLVDWLHSETGVRVDIG